VKARIAALVLVMCSSAFVATLTAAVAAPRTSAVATHPAGSIVELVPTAVIHLGKTADWVAVTADAVWVGSTGPQTVLAGIATGPNPRFLTAGAGAIWTLNQGDGTLPRIESHNRRPVVTVALGTPGHGGGGHPKPAMP
jgi:hypothetical protein